MAYANYAAYLAQYKNPQTFNFYRDTLASTGYPFNTAFARTGSQYPAPRGGAAAVTAPTTAVACDSNTVGAMIRPLAGAGDQVIVAAMYQPRDNAGAGGLLVDRLSHQGGLSGTVTTSQTTNLPTAALTRYTSGVGVYAAIEVYSSLGATDATWTIVYTNQAGTGGRSVTLLLSASPLINGFIPIPLQDTDSGVRSVESVTLTPSTGTAGNFGVTLFKPLAWMPGVPGHIGRPLDVFDIPGWNTPILDDACLQLLMRTSSSISTVVCQMGFGES